MRLLIHDLKADEYKRIESEYRNDCVVSDQGTIRPCIGCFGCWKKDPGRCVVKDGYENMGQLIHEADEVVVISRYSYGGFSSFIKNVFDRCLGYVLPHFELVNGESHHMKRYDEDKPFTFIFYGHDLKEEDKEKAERYVRAVCTNIRGSVKEIIFEEKEERERRLCEGFDPEGRAVLLNVSMRTQGNSARLAEKLKGKLKRKTEVLSLAKYLNDMSSLLKELSDASVIIFSLPLYVDGLPSQMIRLLERFEEEYHGLSKKIYVLANMGLYESGQLVNLFDAVKTWCGKMGFDYCGGIGVSAGELIGVLMQHLPFRGWPMNRISKGMDALAQAIDGTEKIGDIYSGPVLFPRSLYIAIANRGWAKGARENGLDPKELFRRL